MNYRVLRAFAPAIFAATILAAPTALAAESTATTTGSECPPPSGTGICDACPPGGYSIIQVWVAGHKVAQLGDYC